MNRTRKYTAALALFAGVAMGQTNRGGITGTVFDQTGAIVPNAAVTVISLGTNQETKVKTTEAGTYNALSLEPFPGNVIPASMLDASALKALTYLAKAPGGGDSGYFINSAGGISNLRNPRVLKQDETRYTLRIDQAISSANRLYGRYSATPIVRTLSFPIATANDTGEYSSARQVILADTHTFSPSVINDLRLNYTRGRFSNTVAPQFDAKTGDNLNTILGLPNITKGGVPLISGLGVGSGTGVGIGSGGSTEVEDREERYALTDTLYKNHGTMSLKFGVDISHALQNVIPLYAALGGVYPFAATQTNSNGTATGTGGQSFASFLLGVPNGNVTLRSTQIPYYYRWNSYAGFVQDDWKVRPNLTLNPGVRYQLQMPRTEKYNNQGVFRPDLAQTVPLPAPLTLADGEVIRSVQTPPFAFSGRGSNSKYLTPPDYMNFEPRFGFAWSPTALRRRQVTLRGGYGISHAPITGSFRLPQPDFGATQGFASTTPSNTANPNYLMRLGSNPPLIVSQSPTQAINAPADGMVFQNSLYYQASAFAVSQNYHTPYIQNWNLTVSWQANRTTTVELSYTGLKGTRLFMPHENINPKNVPLINAQNAANVNTTATVNDPLGRINLATGRVLTVQNGSLGSPYLGFSSLYLLYDASANSIRHGGSVSVVHRVNRGLTFTANYTWAKSIDDSSSLGGDKNVLTNVGGFVDGQVGLGGTRKNDRSVSTFDQRHVINGTFLYDLPFGYGRRLLNNAWKPLDVLAGGWTMSGVVRFRTGFPFMTYLSDTNQLADLSNTVRPDLVPGVPVVNPLWSRSCPTGAGCQPYLNSAAFERPPLGQLGSAPRTLDGARGPWNQFFDLSIQKSFKLGESGKRRIQIRADALNILNHPTFLVYPNNGGGQAFMGAPSTAALTASDYNTWATANNQPLAATPAGTALLGQVNNMVNAQKNAAGVLPLNFFTTRLPDNFWGKSAGSFDISTLNGYKLFRLRQAYNNGFGDLYWANPPMQPRYIQLGLKIYF